jgi:hypothetical protein
MRPLVMDIMTSNSFRERGLFEVRSVEKLVGDVTAGRREGAYLVLALVLVELWLRQFSDSAEATGSSLTGYRAGVEALAVTA